jgi:hypothetical protein
MAVSISLFVSVLLVRKSLLLSFLQICMYWMCFLKYNPVNYTPVFRPSLSPLNSRDAEVAEIRNVGDP